MRVVEVGPGCEGQSLRQLEHLDEDPPCALGIHRWLTTIDLQLQPTRRRQSGKRIYTRLPSALDVGIDNGTGQAGPARQLSLAQPTLGPYLLCK